MITGLLQSDLQEEQQAQALALAEERDRLDREERERQRELELQLAAIRARAAAGQVDPGVQGFSRQADALQRGSQIESANIANLISGVNRSLV